MNLPSNNSYVRAPRIVRASRHTTHFQAFGLSDRIYYGDSRHDIPALWSSEQKSPIAPVRVRSRAVSYRMTAIGAVRI